ncbi:MAG: ImmA/IrrE family metallo-endopeptidase [Peptoniphilaceae bacterium]|nr:ImmA/IrrE family metallo-endopeptidase [Peptoniphilaceae bacterium]MDY3738616.1 ImmA/IrrE family metallo-endopeptidase [Peptoniphilaceae bacterium]
MNNYIKDIADSLVKKVKTRNVKEIADFLNIHIYYNSNLEDLYGFYTVIEKRKAIVVNSNLDRLTQRQVIAHEIGHDRLHSDIVKSNGIIQEFELMDMRTKPEYEANAFASHILIDDEELDLLSKEYNDFEVVSKILGVNINMLMIKVVELNKTGKKYSEMFIPKGDFLKKHNF